MPSHITPPSRNAHPSPVALVHLARSPHITVNRQTKRRKARTPQRSSLRSRRRRQHTTRYTACQYPILQIILGSKAFYTAFRACEDCADFAEVLGGGVGPGSKVAEPLFQLLPEGKGGDGLRVGVGGEGGVVLHL